MISTILCTAIKVKHITTVNLFPVADHYLEFAHVYVQYNVLMEMIDTRQLQN